MDVVVVGAGVFGLWTAHHLHRAGARVTLVEAYGPGHSRSSSGDETRIVRCGYGGDAIYSELARRSLEQWRALDATLGGREEALWHPCGVLWMAAGHDAYTQATAATLRRLDYGVQTLDADAVGSRFPGMRTDGIAAALFEPAGGVVLARRAVRALAGELARAGVRLLHHRAAPAPGDPRLVHLSDGSRLSPDHVVWACGAWLPGVLPDLLGGRIRPTRQVVLYFGAGGGDDRFEPSRWPAWIDFPAGVYGTPDVNGRGVKVGIDEHGPAIDPDADDRIPDAASIRKARAWLAQRIPLLADAPVVEARVCAYENTDTGDFLIDRHPEHANVWIVGGGSGHGFKHGPAVGELATRMIGAGAAPEPRFTLRFRTSDARRSVY